MQETQSNHGSRAAVGDIIMDLPAYLQKHQQGLILSVKVQPRASKDEVGPVLGNELKVKVTAPPVDAAANQAVLRLLADQLHCPQRQLQLLRGRTSRHKTILITGLAPETVAAKLG